MLVANLFLGLGLSETVAADQQSMADVLHSITSHCVARDKHTACSSYANEQLATCSPDDLSCHCSKVTAIQDYCREVCDLSDYVSDSTRIFLEDTCKLEKVDKRDAGDSSRSSDIQGFALKQMMEPNQLPHGLSHLMDDGLSPAVMKEKVDLHTGIDVTPKHAKSEGNLEKRSVKAEKGMDLDMKPHYLDPITGEIYPANSITEWLEGGSVEDEPQEYPVEYINEQDMFYPMNVSGPSMENPPSFYRDKSVPDDGLYYYYENSRTVPEEDKVTLYFEFPATPLEVSATSFEVSTTSFEVSATSLEVSATSLEVSATSLEVPATSLEVPEIEVSTASLEVSATSLEVLATSLEVLATSLEVPEIEVSTASLENVTTPDNKNVTGVLSKLREKLNIHHVPSAHLHSMTTSQSSDLNSSGVTTCPVITTSKASLSKPLSTKSQQNSNSSATLKSQTSGHKNRAMQAQPVLTIAFICPVIATFLLM